MKAAGNLINEMSYHLSAENMAAMSINGG